MTTEKIRTFTGLVAWQKSHELVIATHRVCESMNQYDALRGQLERAVISITSNISEGFGRSTSKDKKHFYVIARGSAYEVQNQLIIAKDTGRISQEDFSKLSIKSLDSTRLLHGLIRSLERSQNATTTS